MHVQDLKRWHWIALGAVAGAAFALARLQMIADRPVGGADFISQAEFESRLRYPAVMGKPNVANLVIHPGAGEVDLVSLSELKPGTLNYADRWFAAPRPYVPLAQRGSGNIIAGYTVQDYLLEAGRDNPSIKFSSAWWESTAGAIALWGVVGMLVIGGAWPFLLNFLIGAGFGRKTKETLLDLSQFKSEAAEQANTELSEEDRLRLEALEAEMEAALQGDGSAKPVAGAAAVPAPVKQLATAPVERGLAQSQDDKDFAGEFYPVEKKAPHGFTLVEILVAIGVIAMLIAILLPILAHVRARSQQVKCASNLEQIGAGLELYNQSFKHLPMQADPANLAAALKLINIEGIMNCPADQGQALSYGLNAAYAGMPKSSGNASEVMASESAKRHDGKSNVVFFDGHVDEQ